MKRKSKGETIELLYTKPEKTNKQIKNRKTKTKKKNVGATNSHTQKNNINTTINLDNEIIIGLTPKKVENKRKNNKTNSKKQRKNKSINQVRATSKNNKNKKQSKKKKVGLQIFKWTSILVLITTAIIFFMMSSVFNIKAIIVSNNNKISSEEIIKLSGLTTGINMFKISNNSIRNGLKVNPYIQDVRIRRDITGTVEIEVEERVPTYMLKFANAYVYIIIKDIC